MDRCASLTDKPSHEGAVQPPTYCASPSTHPQDAREHSRVIQVQLDGIDGIPKLVVVSRTQFAGSDAPVKPVEHYMPGP